MQLGGIGFLWGGGVAGEVLGVSTGANPKTFSLHPYPERVGFLRLLLPTQHEMTKPSPIPVLRLGNLATKPSSGYRRIIPLPAKRANQDPVIFSTVYCRVANPDIGTKRRFAPHSSALTTSVLANRGPDGD